jgi:hypothetical protein
MQCGCPECGILMAQAVKGLDSACVCPACGFSCRACLGVQKGADAVIEKGASREEWEAVLRKRMRDIDGK